MTFQKISLMMIVIIASSVIPIFLTGEPAEEFVEHLPDVSKNIITIHEEAAEVAFILTLLSGFISLSILLFSTKITALKRYGATLVILSCLLSLSFLIYTANKGGEIRHSEVRNTNSFNIISPLKTDNDDDID